MLSVLIENYLNRLNEYDVLPLVSSIYSGPVRILVGSVQIVANTALTSITICFGWVNGATAWRCDILIDIQKVGHGISNCGRGLVAAVPIAGNLVIAVYDRKLGRTGHVRPSAV